MKTDNWILKAFLLTFFMAIFFSGITNIIADNVNYIFLIIIILIVVVIGILFDMIGMSILTSSESTFHAKSSRKIKGAKEAIYLIKNASVLSNICNDIVGDICGIVSGGLSAILSIYVSSKFGIEMTVTTLLISALVSSLTVGGKAIGKKYAKSNSDVIVDKVAKIIYIFKFKKEK